MLFSDGMIKFFDVFEEDALSAKECYEQFKVALPFVADEIHLGRLETIVIVPASMYNANSNSEVSLGYEFGDKEYEEEPLVFKFSTGEHGKVLVKMHSKKGYIWNEEEKKELKVFARNLFFLGSRASLVEMIKQAMVTDNVTGLDNVNGFMKYASEISYKFGLEKYHAIRFNIKNFGYIINSLPRTKNNLYVRTYANVIKEFIGDRGRIARLGGDNFVALIKDEFVDELIGFLLEVPINVDNKAMIFNARMGVYDIQPKDNMSDVMSYIDLALGSVKLKGNDIVRYEDHMIKDKLKDKNVTANFSSALTNNEFKVYFQPKVNINDKTLYGCEALARWIKDGEMISPIEFIPVLEDDGTICDLDYYIFEETCKYINKWIGEGSCPNNVSINFSKIHLKNIATADKIFAIIDKYKVPPHVIEIELTEMSGYDDFDSLEAFMNRMKEKGVRTSIDDFGTGYSSLQLLSDLDVDAVKLDKSISGSIGSEDSKNKVLLHNVVNMVHELGYSVIAEGVETKEQMDFLKTVGCSKVQGYLFDKPLPAEEFEERLLHNYKFETK